MIFVFGIQRHQDIFEPFHNYLPEVVKQFAWSSRITDDYLLSIVYRRADGLNVAYAYSVKCGGLLKAALTLLMLAGCAPLPDDEAAWVLEDLAAREGESRLKQRTLDPKRVKKGL